MVYQTKAITWGYLHVVRIFCTDYQGMEPPSGGEGIGGDGMKKAIIIICCALLILLCGCGRKTGESFTESGRFIIVYGDNPNAPYRETVIADKDTGVLYLVVYGYNHLGITPILDSDGAPLLSEEVADNG